MDTDNNGGNESTEERGFGEIAEREESSTYADESEDTQDEQEETESEETSDTDEQTDDQGSEDGKDGETEDNDSQKPKLTEKGTKIDPNPKSAVHQQLANERRVRTQMEKVLSSPELLTKFMKEQYGIELPTVAGKDTKVQPEPSSTKKWTAKDFENIEDVADKFNSLQEQFTSEISKRDQEISKLQKSLGGITENSRISRIADNLEGDVNSLRTMAELNPKSPEFIDGLEDEIGALYHKLDFDEATGMYRGNYSLREIGQSIINTARKAKKAGSQRAQTIIKDKNGGQVRTTPAKSGTVDRDTLPAGQSIAQGIAKMFKN